MYRRMFSLIIVEINPRLALICICLECNYRDCMRIEVLMHTTERWISSYGYMYPAFVMLFTGLFV